MTRPELWPRRTERLELRPPTEADLDAVLAWRNHPEVNRWLLRTEVDPEAYRELWRSGADDPLDHHVVAVAATARSSARSRSRCATAWGRARTRRRAGARGRSATSLDPAHHGRGYATEMVRAALDLAFGDLGLRRVTAGCFADNVASWRVMEKVGMRREQHGIRDSWHAELGWVDGFTYAVLADERR